jgi:hypothetical protein
MTKMTKGRKEGRKEGRKDGWMINGQETILRWVP